MTNTDLIYFGIIMNIGMIFTYWCGRMQERMNQDALRAVK